MIRFSCSHCGSKFQAKEERAGRRGNCPKCRQPIAVPQPEPVPQPQPELQQPEPVAETVAVSTSDGSSKRHPPAAGQDGAGRNACEMTAAGESPSEAGRSAVAAMLAGRVREGSRYQIQQEIARGGMGSVVRAVDCDIRREVAIKYMLNESDQANKVRFVEEAQITGQLEHPNIVPIHELGLDAEQRLFFTMKMVRGRSLGEILKELREESSAAEHEWPLSRLLNIFVNVCHAMAYAHSRGVLHRDLKPANIMVGDFGEVYVMDWGLAKSLNDSHRSGEQDDEAASAVSSVVATATAAAEVPASATDSKAPSGGSTRVVTVRETDGELTQEGSIMGTPAYMSPEQARGDVLLLDQRSDIYSLGAILYEMLTLLTPADKEGGNMAMLMRVIEGKITPPEVRTPQRAREGKIPKELSAIAMKALALERAGRYADCEALRQDIERFQEGRSVSARHDSFREMAWKLVKRNKGASITAAVALAVLVAFAAVFLKINYDARVLAEAERGKAEAAYAAYQQQVKDSAPVLVRAATAALKERRFDDALAQAELAVKSDPESAVARLLLGKLLIAKLRFAEALPELEEHVALSKADTAADTTQLIAVCRTAKADDIASLLAFANMFTQHHEYALADGVLSGQAANAVDAREQLLALYRQRIAAVTPGQENSLTLDGEGRFSLKSSNYIPFTLTDVTPLKGMPLIRLAMSGGGKLQDLNPLRGMPLEDLGLVDCQVTDLSPLVESPIKSLSIGRCTTKDFRPLRLLPLKSLHVENCKGLTDVEFLQGTQLEQLTLVSTPVRDVEPLRGMPLKKLAVQLTGVPDLEPLRGMPLTELIVRCWSQINAQVSDLEPLRGMPLERLDIGVERSVTDLEPLRGMPLVRLAIFGGGFTDVDLLRAMPLKDLNLYHVKDVDLTVLEGMQLEKITLRFDQIKQNQAILRTMKTLRFISCDKVGAEARPPAEFWEKYVKELKD